MATIFGNIKGCAVLREAVSGGNGGLALVTVELGAYVAATDNAQLGGGGKDGNVATTQTLAQIIAGRRRDGKTVTFRGTNTPCMAETGLQGSTEFYAGTFAISGNNVTFNVEQQNGTEVNAPAGVVDRPLTLIVPFYLV